MKRIISILMTIFLLAGVLAGCGNSKAPTPEAGEPTSPSNPSNPGDPSDPESGDGPLVLTSLPEGMSGKEAASLILANQRLNSQILKNSGNIFEDGAEVLTNLSYMAASSLANYTLVTNESKSATPLASTKYETDDGSFVEVDGNIYKWGGFNEYSNSYDYFLNLTKGVTSSAKAGAQLIDNVKKYVRVVDQWVKIHGEEYYLHVEENREVLFSRSQGLIDMCERTKTEEGDNRYEIYRTTDEGQMRMVYIAGKVCEYSYVIDGGFNHNFLAENNKGYWEVVDVGVSAPYYNVSCMVVKDDICYDAFYDPNMKEVGTIKVISADRKTDIMNFTQYHEEALIDIALQGFTGYSAIVKEATPDKVGPMGEDNENIEIHYDIEKGSDDRIYHIAKDTGIYIILDNGEKISLGDTFLDGKVVANNIRISHYSREPDENSNGMYIGCYVPQLTLDIAGNSFEEIMSNLDAFLQEAGLKCKRDINYVKAGILQAQRELEQFTKYHQWNESPIYSNEDLAKGWENNLAKLAGYKAEYEKIKDVEVLDFSNKKQIELNIKFAPITAQTAASVKNDGLTVSVSDLELAVSDTLLFVVDEAYTVNFALVGTGDGASSGLNHIELKEPLTTVFKDGEGFKVKQTASFDIPVLGEGGYALVAYLSTADGIRASDYTELVFTEVSAAEEKHGDISVALSKNTEGKLVISCVAVKDIQAELEPLEEGAAHTYATMYEALSKEIYKYGFVAENAVLEILGEDEAWTALTESEDALESGTYRLKYYLKNGEAMVEGYVFTEYVAPEVTEPAQPGGESVQPGGEPVQPGGESAE